jgi:hypothetical protein
MLKVMAIGSLALSMFVPLPDTTPSTVTPPGDKIVIELVTVNGSGCKEGTAKVAVNLDNTAFTVTYSDFLAQAGGGVNSVESRKNCQLNLRVHVPNGFTYAISQTDYRGYAFLAKGASAIQRANYYFGGLSTTAYSVHSFKGPLDDDWQTTDIVDYPALSYLPCGEQRNLNINTELRASAGTSDPSATSFITMDSTDTSLSTTYHFAWKECQ